MREKLAFRDDIADFYKDIFDGSGRRHTDNFHRRGCASGRELCRLSILHTGRGRRACWKDGRQHRAEQEKSAAFFRRPGRVKSFINAQTFHSAFPTGPGVRLEGEESSGIVLFGRGFCKLFLYAP